MSDRQLSPALKELASIERASVRLGAEIRLRPSTTSTVLILDNTMNYIEKKRHFGAPGTITVFLGRSPNSLARVVKAAEEGLNAVDEIVNEILHAPGDESATLEEAFSKIADAPVIATLKYGGKALVENLAIPEGRDLLGFTLPYSGGRIASKGLELEQSYRGAKAELYTGVALATCPPLTPAETAAVSQVPEDELLLSIGSLADCTLGCVGASLSGAAAGVLGGAQVGAEVGIAIAGPGGAFAGGIVGGVFGAFAGGWAGYEAYSGVANALAGGGNNAGQAADAGAAQADAGAAAANAGAAAGDGAAGAADAGAGDAGAGDGGGGGGDGGYIPFFGVVADGGYKYQVGDPYADIVSRDTEGTARKLLEMRRVELLKSIKRR